MADGSNLKAKVGMDTGDFEKGAKKVAKAAQSMGKDMTTSLTDVGKAIGVDTGLLGDMAGRIQNATTLFRGMGSAGGGAASSLTKAMTGLGGAIAGLGITAAIVAFRELNQEAANFEQRLQGVNLAQAAKAARDTYRQSLYDQTGRGEDVAMTKEYWQTRLSMGWADLTTGASKEEREKAMRAAEEAARLASERVDLQRQLDQSVVAQAATQARINELSNVARDNSKTLAERSEARSQAEVLTNQLYDRQIMLQNRLADNWRQTNAIVSSTDEEMRQQYQAEAAVHNLEGQRQSTLRALIRMNNTLSNSAKSHADSAKEAQKATELTLEAATRLVEAEREKARLTAANERMMQEARNSLAMERYNETWGPGIAQMPGIPGMPANALALPTGDLQKSYDTVKMSYIDLTDTIVDGASSMADAIGMLAADLINGENAWGNFAQAGISVVADMLSTVGKAFITEGIGVEAAQMALKTGNGLGAIAAGGAMVALAAAMRTAMSNASANWSGGGSSVASSAYSGGSSNTPTAYGREMTVHVTGTLTGEGSKLVAVLNNEADRKRVTT